MLARTRQFWLLRGAAAALVLSGLVACGGSSDIGSPQSISTRLASSGSNTSPSSQLGTPVVSNTLPDSVLTPEGSTTVVTAPLDQTFELKRGETGRIAGANASVTLTSFQAPPLGCTGCPASISLRVIVGTGQVMLSYAFTPDQLAGGLLSQSVFGYTFKVSGATDKSVMLRITEAR